MLPCYFYATRAYTGGASRTVHLPSEFFRIKVLFAHGAPSDVACNGRQVLKHPTRGNASSLHLVRRAAAPPLLAVFVHCSSPLTARRSPLAARRSCVGAPTKG